MFGSGKNKSTSVTTLLLILQLLLAGCSGSAVPALPRLSYDAKILAFGDSLTAGNGATREQAYPAVLAQLTRRTVINAGVPGETTEQGAHRLSLVLDQEQPRLVILCLGGNDLLRRVDPALTRSNLEGMIRELQRRGIPTMLLGVPKPALMGLKAEPMYAELAQRYGLPIENDALPELLGDQSRKSDPIHLNAQGYRELAEAIAKLLKASGAI